MVRDGEWQGYLNSYLALFANHSLFTFIIHNEAPKLPISTAVVVVKRKILPPIAL